MSKKLIIATSVAVLVASLGGVALAKKHGHHCGRGMDHRAHGVPHGHHGMDIMRKADTDKDGNISKEELLSAHEAKFKEYDLNSDGVVTAKEVQEKLSSNYEKIAKKITRRFDENRDGKVTADEFKDHAERKLYILDLNDDGVISKEERPRSHMKRMGMRRHGMHHGSRHHPHHKGKYGERRGSHMNDKPKDDSKPKEENKN